jgi:hypothetical protein
MEPPDNRPGAAETERLCRRSGSFARPYLGAFNTLTRCAHLRDSMA